MYKYVCRSMFVYVCVCAYVCVRARMREHLCVGGGVRMV